MNWYRITFTAQEYDSGEMAVLQGAFMEAYVASNAPAGMALFGAWDRDRMHYFVYATPQSVRHIRPLLEAFAAQPVDSLEPSALSLIFGDESGRYASDAGFEA